MTIFDEMKLEPSFNELFLLITNRCNLTCKHCYVSSNPLEPHGIDIETVFKVIDQAKLLNNSIRIVISGGEAMVRKNDVFDIIERYPDNQILLLSNGMHFTKSIASKISCFKNLHIRISIDGHNEKEHDFVRGKGSFKKVIAGIINLNQNQFNNIALSTTVSENTVNSIKSILKLAEDLSIRIVKIEPIAKTGRAVDYYGQPPTNKSDMETELFRNFILENDNIGSWQHYLIDETKYETITIYSNGDVYPYTFYNEYDKTTGLTGNIYKDNLLDIVKSEKWKKAILEKILIFSLGPPRSMGAYNFRNINSQL